jgi:amidase
MDVVVRHTRTMSDMFEVLDVIVADDPNTGGDAQPAMDSAAQTQ